MHGTGEQGSNDGSTDEQLVSRLVRELSGTPIETANSSRPICKRCDDRGESSADLFIDEGETVYACACWRELTGWELFGVYHADHASSLRTLSGSPSKPTITFRGRVTRESGRIGLDVPTDVYRLTDLTFVDIVFPDDLVLPDESGA